jgi:quercetin dioxygenase-like cupin family protein
MRSILCGIGLLAASTLILAADQKDVVFIGHDKMAAALAKQGKPLVSASNLLVEGSHRDGPGQVEVHTTETDVFYVTDGSATFVTGGKMIGGKTTAPAQIRGTSIDGGETHHLVKGDVMVIPAGTPHWFKEVPQSISYFVVKVLKE